MRRLAATLLVAVAGCGDGSAPPADASADLGEWRARAPMPEARLEPAVVALDGKVYVIGGFDRDLAVVGGVLVYDPAADQWSAAAPLPIGVHHANAAVWNGRIYVVGSLTGLDFTADGRVFVYDPPSDAWTAGAPMPAGSERGASGVGAIDGVIYVAGGSAVDALADVSAYQTAGDTWQPLAPLPEPRYHATGAVLGGKLYILGGLSAGIPAGTSHPVADVASFDPAAGAWTPLAPLPTPRGGCAAGVIAGEIVCAGGETASTVSVITEGYDPVADRWRSLAPMLKQRGGAGGAVVDGVLHVPGGANLLAFLPIATHECFTPPPP